MPIFLKPPSGIQPGQLLLPRSVEHPLQLPEQKDISIRLITPLLSRNSISLETCSGERPSSAAIIESDLDLPSLRSSNNSFIRSPDKISDMECDKSQYKRCYRIIGRDLCRPLYRMGFLISSSQSHDTGHIKGDGKYKGESFRF